MKKAILFGATGFVGSCLLQELLDNSDYSQVTIVVRKKPDLNHSKLKTLIGDINSLPTIKEDIQADDIFIALGTTKKNTPDEKEYYKVDHDYPVVAAKIAKEKGAKSVFIVTAVGPNINSGVFYLRTKAELERDIIALDFDHTHIFRPSMIMGNRKESRAFEKVLIKIFSIINPLFVGGLSKYKGSKGEDIAEAMVKAGSHQTEKVKIYHWEEMNELL